MNSLIQHLRHMRGETSAPLRGDLAHLIKAGKAAQNKALSVQVPSTLVSKGLTMILPLGENPQAWIYLARGEVPGFIPPCHLVRLQEAGWQVYEDSYGSEFACVFKVLTGTDEDNWASDLVAGLEALGSPQKREWGLFSELF